MRDLNDKDRKKKLLRISMEDNPANLSAETLALLEAVTITLPKDGSLRCPVAWENSRGIQYSQNCDWGNNGKTWNKGY